MTLAEACRLAVALNETWGCHCPPCLCWVVSQLRTEFPQSQWEIAMSKQYDPAWDTERRQGVLSCLTVGDETSARLDEMARLAWALTAGHRPPPCLLYRQGLVSALAYRLASVFSGFVWRVVAQFDLEQLPRRATPSWAGPVITVAAFGEGM